MKSIGQIATPNVQFELSVKVYVFVFITYVRTKGLSRSAKRSFGRMISSLKVFRSVKTQTNAQYTLYYNVIYRFRRIKI